MARALSHPRPASEAASTGPPLGGKKLTVMAGYPPVAPEGRER